MKTVKCFCVHFAPPTCAHEAGDADDDEKINQQNVVSFSVTGIIRELTCLSMSELSSSRAN